ncbi:alpha amylase C-terminal domain-containing protein [Archangium sp.]|uniref:alpha amylase C-terminal domain-containing protein n=1 Tax=Archangium sp. TaxID=1872627 RepID=UPI002D43458C|nr:alpha amylase C-terminal domain-containing protein [Archangium sp.]HYO55082.1 alpha amylase C-terminal domain-containing protein [Archangium sp.]
MVDSLNRKNLEGYTTLLPPGSWKAVLNSDAAVYGGGNFGNHGATLSGGNPDERKSLICIPSGKPSLWRSWRWCGQWGERCLRWLRLAQVMKRWSEG